MSNLKTDVAHSLRGEGFDAREDGTGRGTPPVPVAWTGDGVTADPIISSEGRTYTHEGTSFRLHNCVQQPVAVAQPVATAMQVRRLTPTECERLQGFPDDYTAIPWRGKSESPDGPRYKALGNSWAVPVVRWIGRRIAAATSSHPSSSRTS